MDEAFFAPSLRSQTRQLLSKILLSDADLDAFCLDYFPDVHQRFASGMDRLSKFNLLLELKPVNDIAIRLKEQVESPDSQLITAIDRILGDNRQQRVRLLESELEAALNRKEDLVARGADTTDVDRHILAMRREQRQGPQLVEGEILAGRYKLLQVLGSGGFADVWQALDRKSQRIVAIKVLHPQWQRDRSRTERFERGAYKMAELSHPHIVRVLSDPLIDQGFLFFVMEYLSGGDLGTALTEPSFKTEDLLRNLLQIGQALEHAHRAGLVHRDVKPQNILLDAQRSARLTDFDLVAGAGITGGTRASGLGSFVYAAPEQLDNASIADHRADIYSLGMVALSVLCRKELPLHAIRDTSSFMVSTGIGNSLRGVLGRATSWDPKLRQQSPAQFCHELEAAWKDSGLPINAVHEFSRPLDSEPQLTLKPSPWRSSTENTLKCIAGIWISDTGTTYCMKLINGEIRCAYCYEGVSELTGHIFDIQVIDDQIFGRFEWINRPTVKGYHFLRLVLDNSMAGGWCYDEDLDIAGIGDVVRRVMLGMNMRAMVSVHANRAADIVAYPLWAEEYFEQRMWLQLEKRRLERST